MSQKKSTGKSREYNPSGRRWWLKLEYAFFFDKRVCALRRKLGDRALIFYEKIMLRSLENSCTMRFEGLEETFADEIAVDIMEDNGDSVQLIKEIMDFLIQHRLMVEQEDKSFLFTQAAEMSGDECSSAERMRRMRERNREASHETDGCCDEASQCYAEPSLSDNQPSHSNEASQCDKKTSQRYHIQNNNNNRSRAKSRIDLDLELELKQESDTEQADADIVSVEQRTATAAADAAAPPAAELFSVDELDDIEYDHKMYLSDDGVKAFHAEMQESGWVLYGKPVTKAGIVKALRGWAKFHREYEDTQFLEEQIQEKANDYVNDEEMRSCQSEKAFYQLIIKQCPASEFDNRMREYVQRKYGISNAVMQNWVRGQ